MQTVLAEVEHLPEPHIAALKPILREAAQEVENDLKKILAKYPDGNFTAQRRRVVLLQLKESLHLIEHGMSAEMLTNLRMGSRRSGVVAIQHLRKQVEAAESVYRQSAIPLQINEAAMLAKGEEFLLPRYRTSARRYGVNMSNDIRRSLAVSVAKGE